MDSKDLRSQERQDDHQDVGQPETPTPHRALPPGRTQSQRAADANQSLCHSDRNRGRYHADMGYMSHPLSTGAFVPDGYQVGSCT